MSVEEKNLVERDYEGEEEIKALKEIHKMVKKIDSLFEEISNIDDCKAIVMLSREIVELRKEMIKLNQEGKVKFNWSFTVADYPPGHLYWDCEKVVQLTSFAKSLGIFY